MRLLRVYSGALLVVIVMCGLVMAQTAATPPSGYITSNGTVMPGVPISTPPTTPQAVFVNQSNAPAGATDATAGNLAGATDATIGNVPGPSSASWSQLAVTTPGAQGMAPPTAAEQTTVGTPGTFNPGVGQFDSAYDFVPTTDDRSLVEVAAESRQQAQQARNVHVFTNQDIHRLNPQTRIANTTVTPPLNSGGTAGAAQNAGAASAGQAGTAPRALASGSNNPSPFSPRVPVATEQAQTSESTPEPQKSRLPATGSPLPLIALLGILAGVASVLCRRRDWPSAAIRG